MATDKENDLLTSAAELRLHAEERLRTKTEEAQLPRSKEATQRLVHELEIYQLEMEEQNTELRRAQEELENQQVELEMQNEELRRVQDDLELSRNKYSELYDFAPVGYFAFDATGVIQNVNLTGARMLGIERQSLVGRPFSLFIADADSRDLFSQHLASVAQKAEMQRCEIRLTGKQGAVIYGQLQSVAAADSASKTGQVLSSLVDGTQARELGVKIQDAREYAENIVETVRKPLVVLDSELKILTANRSFYETFKVTHETTIGHFICDLVSRQWDIPELRALFESILPHGTVINDYEVDHDFPKIGRRIILLNARQIFRKDIGTHIILLAMEDITVRKQAEEELLKAGALQQAIFNSANFSSIATDAEGVIQIFNVGAERMLGYTAVDVMNKITPADISDPEELITRAQALSVELETPITPGFDALVFKARRGMEDIYELTYIRKDGSRFPAVVSVTALRNEHQSIIGYLLIGTDNTARKQADIEKARLDQALQDKNIELENARSVAEKANQAKSEFLSSMSHELRTPLGAILGFAQLLESGKPAPTDGQKRSIDQILKAGWYLLVLINEILDLALIESGKLSLSLEPVALQEVMEECAVMVEPQAQQCGISVTFAELATPYFVNADRTRVKQLLINLLSNAIKYNSEGGTVVVTCTLSPPDAIRISVRDTGAGLAPEQIAQLFQPFNRLGQEAHGEQGTGIGLVVCKRLVELMDGIIGVESRVGEGSVFWLELKETTEPQTDARAVELAKVDQVQSPVGGELYTVLYVEDNPANLMLVEDILARRSDIRLLSARDAVTGIKMALASVPDVVLMDINLPGISGIEALKILAESPTTAHIPVVALSANAIPRDVEKGLEAGFFRYLTKPIKVNQFMETLDLVLKHAKTKAARAAKKDEI